MKKFAAVMALLVSTNVGAELFLNEDEDLLIWHGDIAEGFASEVKSKFEETGINSFAIISEGGLIGESIILGTYLRENGINTIAPGECLSACVNVFVGGTNRIVSYDTKIGVHAFSGVGDYYSKSGREIQQQTQLVTATQTAYLVKMGIDPMVAVKAALIKPENMDFLTIGEMIKFNIATYVVIDGDEGGSNEYALQVPKKQTPSDREFAEFDGKQVEIIRIESDWKQNQNAAGVLKKEPELSGIGIRFVPNSDNVNVTFCSDRPEFLSKQKLQVEYSLKKGEDFKTWSGKMFRAKRAKSCWDSGIVPREMLKRFKNGSRFILNVEGKVLYITSLTGSAKTINAAWAYKEANLMN
jgi:hypothetical protein